MELAPTDGREGAYLKCARTELAPTAALGRRAREPLSRPVSELAPYPLAVQVGGMDTGMPPLLPPKALKFRKGAGMAPNPLNTAQKVQLSAQLQCTMSMC